MSVRRIIISGWIQDRDAERIANYLTKESEEFVIKAEEEGCYDVSASGDLEIAITLHTSGCDRYTGSVEHTIFVSAYLEGVEFDFEENYLSDDRKAVRVDKVAEMIKKKATFPEKADGQDR